MKIYRLLLFFSIFTLLTNCKNAIDILQPGRLGAEQAFRTVSDLQQGLLGVYNEFDYTPAIQFNAVFTDEVSIGFDSGGQGIGNGEYGFRLNPESAIATAQWVNYYDALNAASRLIEAAKNITPSPSEQTNYNNALGAALALRAWAHFELLTYYSTDLTNNNALGVILLDFVPGVSDILPRNTNGEIFTSIEADLDEANTLLSNQSSTSRTFVSKDFIKALRARIAAYRGNYTLADQLASELLASYPIANKTQYKNMYLDTDNTEVIFKLERADGDSYDVQGATGSGFAGGWAGANFAFVNATINGSPYFEMSNSLFGLLVPEDVRYEVNLHPTSNLTDNILVIGKYPGSEGQPLMNDLKIFRSAEMLMIRAEAAANANNLAQVAAFVKQLRDARFGSDQPTPSYANQQQAFLGILQERRIEFAYEGFRWVDLKRLGAKAGISGIVREAQDCAINGACSLPITDHRLAALPIPLVEINANSVIATQQNPGY